MKIHVDEDQCIASGMCVLQAPDIFDQDDEGIVVVLNDNPSLDRAAAARRAVAVCPAAVITFDDNSRI